MKSRRGEKKIPLSGTVLFFAFSAVSLFFLFPPQGFSLPYLKDIKFLRFGEYLRISVEISERLDFSFSAEGKEVKIVFSQKLRARTLRKKGRWGYAKLLDDRRTLLLRFQKKFSFARYFTIPFPFKLIVDVSFRGRDVEDVIAHTGGEKPVLVVDAGHGGKDPGATYRGIKEKHITLRIAREIYKIAKKDGFFRVFLTRKKDRFLSLEERSGMANALGCDVFVSVHVNSARSRRARGFEVFYFSRKFSRYALYIASKENGVRLKGDDLIIFDLSSDYREKLSYSLASHIAKEMRHMGKVRTVEGAPFYVLAGTFCPSALVEVGFITNSYDRRKLTNPRFIGKLALKIYRGIKRFAKSDIR